MALYFLLIYIVVQFFGIKKNGPGAPQPDTHHLVTAAHRPWAVSESVSCEFGQEALVHILAGSHPFQKKKRLVPTTVRFQGARLRVNTITMQRGTSPSEYLALSAHLARAC